jgi:hypothetical protein
MEFNTLPYYLLGDDIVICNADLAELYQRTIRSLGVQFSEQKNFCFYFFLRIC